MKDRFSYKILRIFLLVFISICTFSESLFSQNIQLIQEVNKLDSLEGEKFRSAVSNIYSSFDTIADIKLKATITSEVFKKTQQKDEISHINSLVFMVKYSEKPNTKFYNEAFELAKKHNLVTEMCFVEYTRSHYFIAKKQYDSAMIHLLSYRDMTFPDKKNEGYRNILNILGDIYFHAGLYDQAEEVYLDMLKMYEDEENWNYYRPYVMMNNLGQIAMEQGNFQESEERFSNSLALAEKYLNTSCKENTIAYTKIKLAETALNDNRVERARELLDQVADMSDESIYEDVAQEYIFIKARLLLGEGQLNEALLAVNQLVPDTSDLFIQYRFVPEVYHILSDVYAELGKLDSSLFFMKEYQNYTDSLHIIENLSKSMILLADSNHAETQNKLKKSRQRLNFLIPGIIILIVILLMLLLLYRSLYLSKLKLVKKSLENNVSINQVRNGKETSDGNTYNSEEEYITERNLIIRLQEYMKTEKPYLNPKISMEDLSKQLSTNRSYLSRAINNQMMTSFPNYINLYRIQESIRLIADGYAVNHTQEALAKESGFASRTVFITAFKKHTGIVPSFFIANYKKRISEYK